MPDIAIMLSLSLSRTHTHTHTHTHATQDTRAKADGVSRSGNDTIKVSAAPALERQDDSSSQVIVLIFPCFFGTPTMVSDGTTLSDIRTPLPLAGSDAERKTTTCCIATRRNVSTLCGSRCCPPISALF
jgi:hypothetical protein